MGERQPAAEAARTYVVRKRDKRLWIDCLETGDAIYTPPDFLRLQSRAQLAELAERLTAGMPYIDAVMAFETKHNPRCCAPRGRR